VLSQAKAMKDLGLVDLGYNSFLLDDCMTEYVFLLVSCAPMLVRY
jgi:hypothetical protein